MNKVQKIEKFNEENNKITYEFEKILSQLNNLVEGQEINKNGIRRDLRLGFIGLTGQNQILATQNDQILKANKYLTEQLENVSAELKILKTEREKIEIRKQISANRKRLPKRDPMTRDIYTELIKAAEGPTYLNVRLRVALCLLAVTGLRINELLNIEVSQLKTLTQESWIAIDRSKRGPSNHKAFLTKEGKKIIQDRKKDFKFIFLIKKPDAYVFTSEANHYKKLRREAITKDVNKVMRTVSNQLPGQPNVTSHSFRIGSITQLWKDSKDIEFVKQSIGHRKLDTTSAYVNQLSDQERQKRIDQLE
jgi:integrase